MPLGLPHSVFLSWSEADQDKALAYQTTEATRCSRCGTFSDEWLDEKGYPIEPPPYVAVGHRCGGCLALGELEDTIPSGRHGDQMRLVPWTEDDDDDESDGSG